MSPDERKTAATVTDSVLPRGFFHLPNMTVCQKSFQRTNKELWHSRSGSEAPFGANLQKKPDLSFLAARGLVICAIL
jgi:hypothetical protein